MRIETMTTAIAVHVSASDGSIELRIGEPPRDSSAVSLSVTQAEMLLHALGLAIARVHEQQRRAAEDRAHVAQVVADTEVRRP
jgi:hypothetical protein